MYNVVEPISLKSAWELMERLVDCLAAIRHGPCVLFIVFCPDYFVVGYGMDFAELYRNLPYVGVLKPEHYK